MELWNKKTLLRALHEKGRSFVALPPFFTDHSHDQPPSDVHQHLSTITGGTRRSLLCLIISISFRCAAWRCIHKKYCLRLSSTGGFLLVSAFYYLFSSLLLRAYYMKCNLFCQGKRWKYLSILKITSHFLLVLWIKVANDGISGYNQ